MSNKKKILIFSEYYLPGFKSGGGMRTIVNIVTTLKDRYDFYIVTKDHDGRSDKTPYQNVELNHWNKIEDAKVFYLSNKLTSFSKILELINEVKPDILYSNSYLSSFNRYLLILNKLKKINVPYLISPCGELSDGAMQDGFIQKKLFLTSAGLLKLHKRVFWKVTDAVESGEIERLGVKKENIYIAPDLVEKTLKPNNKEITKPVKTKGEADFIFLSRFCEKKNFKFLVENLMEIKGKVTVDVYAPIESKDYWEECQEVIKKLPENIKIIEKKPVPHSDVHNTLLNYHFFTMPTLGENFGHVFIEALSAGCPLLISDRTPWRDLETKRVGWDLTLENRDVWKDKINQCVEMSQEEYAKLSNNSKAYADEWFEANDLDEITIRMFEDLLK